MDRDLQELVPPNLISLVEEYSPDIFYLADIKNNRYLYMSPTEEILGYSSDLFCGANGLNFCLSIMHPEDVNLIMDNYIKMLEKFSSPEVDKSDVRSFVTEYRIKQANGNWVWWQSKDYVVKYDDEGKVHLTFGLATIIDARKEKEKSIAFTPTFENLIRELENKITVNKKIFQNLSLREKQIIKLLGEGLSTKQMAEKLGLSYYTVETHRKNILQKLHIKNTAELIKNFYKYSH